MDYNFSDRLKNLQGNAIREIFKLLANPEVISFAGGMPATDCIALDLIKKYTNEVLSESGFPVLQYGATEGYLPLRNKLISYIEKTGLRNIELSNILVTSGGQQGIDLTFKAFINKGDCILVEDPTYLAVLHIAKTYEAKVVGVKSDADGINLEDLEDKIKTHKPKIFYVVPNFSNPTGKTLSEQKRKDIVSLTIKYNVIVLEDDPYRDLRYTKKPVNSIKSFDKAGNVIYLTSFSKIISPGLRVGAAFANEEIIRKLTIGKQATDVHTSTLSQAIVEKFLYGDTLEKLIAANVPKYKQRLDAMISAIKKYMPPSFKFTVPDGGLFIWGEFADGLSAKAYFQKAVTEHKVAYVCGNDFFADGHGDNFVRLNFSNASVEKIDEGIKKLGTMFSIKS